MTRDWFLAGVTAYFQLIAQLLCHCKARMTRINAMVVANAAIACAIIMILNSERVMDTFSVCLKLAINNAEFALIGSQCR